MEKLNIHLVNKATLIHKIEEAGCDMLKGKLKGNETKEQIIRYLKLCHCPKIHAIFSFERV